MSLVYFLAEYFPFWSVPTVLICFELANRARRRSKKLKVVFWGLAALVLASLTTLYVVHDGYHKLRPAIQAIEQSF